MSTALVAGVAITGAGIRGATRRTGAEVSSAVMLMASISPEIANRRSRREKEGGGGHQIILLASLPPAWAETSSTIRLMAIVKVAIASAGTSGAMEP